ncbi:hypothetical protein NPX13_g461 [Xylaria arbuscula]|uniref:Rhodopsin domain-containing protein n=1 Tax=Xylaria arbuscula TaxID=114810 RepID=A0A9W8NNU2_9PEZI|nr:hypothetical protein NPX13_g461 [Xylaria arbuscula]
MRGTWSLLVIAAACWPSLSQAQSMPVCARRRTRQKHSAAGKCRDITATTPIIVAVSGILAIVTLVMRVIDIFPNRTFQPADYCAIAAVVVGIPLGVLDVMPWLWQGHLDTNTFSHNAYCEASAIAFTLTGIFYCTPISYIWTGWTGETEGSCINFNAFAWAHAVTSIVQDLWIIGLPIPSLLKLHLGTRRKVHLILMFSVGLAITIVSVVRLTTLVQFATTTNPTYDSVSTAYWSILEAYVSIICCCLPSVRSLLRTVVPSCFGSSNDPNSQSYKLSGTPMTNSRVINKTVTHQISYLDRANESDDIELVEKGSGQPAKYSGW